MVLNEAMKQGAVPDGYSEISVEFFQFKNEGDKLDGRLVTKTTTNVRGGRDVPNKVGKYNLVKTDGKKVTFLGGVHLDELLSNVPLGSEIMIVFTHKEKTESDYELKKFKVFIKDRT